MSDPQYHCQQPSRVAAVRQHRTLNGIEYLEVSSTDQLTLRVFFVLPVPDAGAADERPEPPAPKLTAANFRLEGGVRIPAAQIRILDAVPAGVTMTLTLSATGDFSTYTLRLVGSDVSEEVPPGYDPRLAAIDFSFKANCPSEFDCRTTEFCPPPVLPEPTINYLAKDYASFRRLMLDRLGTLMPEWRDRSAADPLVTVVEALAAEADRLSYWQDAIATEAYLGTARSRTAVRRHARLLDYRVHDGCNARTWVHFACTQAGTVTTGSPVLTRGGDGAPVLANNPAALLAALREQPTVFATLHDVFLAPAHNRISLYTWSDTLCCLPAGATRATLRNDPPLTLAVGDWLLFEEVAGPVTGLPADADPQRRQVVRLTAVRPGKDLLTGDAICEVEWSGEDALAFPLTIGVRLPLANADTEVGIARGNLALADHGWWSSDVDDPDKAADPDRRQWFIKESVALEPMAEDRAPRARLADNGITFAVAFDPQSFAAEATELLLPPEQRVVKTFLTGAGAVRQRPAEALPVVDLTVDGTPWRPQRELLSSDRFATEFVVEVENDGTTLVRFGDGVHGARPAATATIMADYRRGNGRAGNVGREALCRVQTAATGIVAVRNPLAATGGIDPEPVEEVRQFAPQAFRRQERAVTEADWVEVAQRHPAVQRAAAQFRWTGSWHTVFVTVDRKGGLPVEGDPVFLEDFGRHLDRFRLAGYDLEINGPVFVPLDVAFEVCVKPGHFRADVKAALLDVFGSAPRTDGQLGFFHPDKFSFGDPVYLSRLYAAAMAVPGVNHVEVVRFQRFGILAAGELEAGVIRLGALEVARCDNDRNFPENGRIEFTMEGGV